MPGQADAAGRPLSSSRWHSHTGVHYQDGLRAPLIIHAPTEPHKYDEEYVIVLSDWYHERAEKEVKTFMSKYNPTGAGPSSLPPPLRAALSLMTVPRCDWQSLCPILSSSTPRKEIRTCLRTTMSSSTTTFRFRSKPERRIAYESSSESPSFLLCARASRPTYLLFRSAGIFSMNYFWIDGHEMRVIEADGTDIEEFPVDHLTLSVAQRYSVLVTARNDTNSNFFIHAMFDETMFDTVPDGLVVSESTFSGLARAVSLQC